MEDSNEFEFRSPLRWRIGFSAMSLVPLWMIWLVWSKLFSRPPALEASAFVFPLLFTVFVGGLAGILLYSFLRTVHLRSIAGRVIQTVRVLGIPCSTREYDKAYLVRQWLGNKKPQLWYAVYGRSNSSKTMIASEQTCESVAELFSWFENQPDLDCVDMSKRRPLGK